MDATVLDRLKFAGLTITLLPPDKIEVSPAERLTDELRQMIRANKPQLMEWLWGTQLPTSERLDVRPMLKAASKALDDQIKAAGGSLALPPEPPPSVAPPPPRGHAPGRTQITATPQPWHHIEASWRPLAQAYHAHHFQCVACQCAGRGYGLRCGTGAALWHGYQDAAQ